MGRAVTKTQAKRTSLYRLNNLRTLSDAIKEENLEKYGADWHQCSIAGRECILVTASIVTNPVKWGDRIQELTGITVALKNETAMGVLLIPESSENVQSAWALCWGMGWLLLDQSKVDTFFGQRIALRLTDPDKLVSIIKKTLDEKAKVDQTSIPSGERVSRFGIEGIGEAVTKIVGKADLSEFSFAKNGSIHGSDSLKIPLGVSSDNLVEDLNRLVEIMARPIDPELEILEQLQNIKQKDSVRGELEDLLIQAIVDPSEASAVGIAFPMQVIENFARQETYRIRGAGARGIHSGIPELEDFRDLLRGVPKEECSKKLSSIKIQLFADGEARNAISREIPLRNWIAYEVDHQEKRYFLHEGDWYRIHGDYEERLNNSVEKIFAKSAPVELSPWRKGEDEAAYNMRVSGELKAKLTDRDFIRTKQNARGFEPCDIFTEKGELIHIKKAKSSSTLSHLFAQGENSAHSLSYDDEARREFKSKFGEEIDFENWRPKCVIFGICKPNGQLTSNSLFAFSKVTLHRAAFELEQRGIDVFVAPIEFQGSD